MPVNTLPRHVERIRDALEEWSGPVVKIHRGLLTGELMREGKWPPRSTQAGEG